LSSPIDSAKRKLSKKELIGPRALKIVQQIDHNDRTLLHIACMEGSLPDVDALLTAKADPFVVDRDGFTPLHLANIVA
jgi:ankyrin repeat protein